MRPSGVKTFIQSDGEITLSLILEKAFENLSIAAGVNTYDGKLTNRNVVDAHGYEYVDLGILI